MHPTFVKVQDRIVANCSEIFPPMSSFPTAMERTTLEVYLKYSDGIRNEFILTAGRKVETLQLHGTMIFAS